MNQSRPILYGIWCTPTPANANQLPGSFIPAGPWSYEEARFRAEQNNQSNRYFHYEPRPAYDPEPIALESTEPEPKKRMSPPTVPFDPDAGPEEEPDFPQPDTMLQARIDAFCEHWAGQFMGQAASGEMLGKLAWRASHELGTPIVITVARNLRGMDVLVGYPLPPIPTVRGATGATGPMGPPGEDPTRIAQAALERLTSHNEALVPRRVEWVCPDCGGEDWPQTGSGTCPTCHGTGRVVQPYAPSAREIDERTRPARIGWDTVVPPAVNPPLDRDQIARIARWDALREQAPIRVESCIHGTPGCTGRGDKHACNEPDPFGSNW